ncbi:hypothetical protein RYA05_03255 [Pseudomonas syringae pv. actinidiae]|nr:hypothetical protein [Pseudomonas syringae pv. actinidiae]
MVLMKKYALGLALVGIITSVNADTLRFTQSLNGDLPIPDWLSADTKYGDWTATSEIYGCSNWSPAVSSTGKGIAFKQTATDCHRDESRSAQPQRKDRRTGKVEPIPNSSFVEKRVSDSNLTKERDAVGILEQWDLSEPTYSPWKNISEIYGCSTWSGDPSAYKQTTNLTQTSTDCKVNQSRTKQEHEQEVHTGAIRDIGKVTTEEQTIAGQSGSRIYNISYTEWVNSGATEGCLAWSPDVSTIRANTSFTQTRTGCKTPQTRTRTESITSLPSRDTTPVGSSTEKQSIDLPAQTQQAVGTRTALICNHTDGYVGDVGLWHVSPSTYSSVWNIKGTYYEKAYGLSTLTVDGVTYSRGPMYTSGTTSTSQTYLYDLCY